MNELRFDDKKLYVMRWRELKEVKTEVEKALMHPPADMDTGVKTFLVIVLVFIFIS